MTDDDINYYRQLADIGPERAQQANRPEVVGVHCGLAGAYPEWIAPFESLRQPDHAEEQQLFPSSDVQRLQRSSFVSTQLTDSPYLSSEERQALKNVTVSSRTVKAHTALLREGESTDTFHFVSQGWACRYKTTRSGARQIVALLVPGDAANLDSLLCGRQNYSIRALTAMNVLTISHKSLMALVDEHAGIAKSFAWLAFAENAILRQWALCLGQHSAKQRLAHLLCEIAVRLGGDWEDRFDMPLTQEQIGDVLGLTAVHVNRMIRQLRSEGLIEVGGRAVTIADFDALSRIGDFDPAYLQNGHDLRPVSRRERRTDHHLEASQSSWPTQ